jgi:hypothetical protein
VIGEVFREEMGRCQPKDSPVTLRGVDAHCEKWLALQLSEAPSLSDVTWQRVARIIATRSRPEKDQSGHLFSVPASRLPHEGQSRSRRVVDLSPVQAKPQKHLSVG